MIKAIGELTFKEAIAICEKQNDCGECPLPKLSKALFKIGRCEMGNAKEDLTKEIEL